VETKLSAEKRKSEATASGAGFAVAAFLKINGNPPIP
jgi:hypothetical protein